MHRIATFLRQRASAATLAIAVAVLSTFSASAQDGESPVASERGAKHRIVISLTDRRLYLFGEEGGQRSFPVAIGRPGVAIPLGDSIVVRKRRHPTWHPTASQRRAKPSLPLSVPPGPGNPLGKYALDLGWTAIAIHGTNEPHSIGRRVSSGCFRMMPDDIESLFAVAEVGTPVRVIAASLRAPDAAPIAPKAQPPAPVPVRVAPLPAPPPAPPPVVPDPRCPTASAPLRRMICTVAELAVLDGRARGMQERFLGGLPPEGRDAASFALFQEERRFEDRVTTQCWIRKGSEDDPAVAAAASACLHRALSGRIDDVQRKIAELGGAAKVAARP